MLYCFGIAIGVILIFMPVVSCSYMNKKSHEQTNTSALAVSYNPPAIPLVFKTPGQQADFLAEHYWDNFRFDDTSAIKAPKTAEQAFVDFIAILRQVPFGKAIQGIGILVSNSVISQKTFLFFLGTAEKYLYNPNSPFRNELFYEPFLKAALASDAVGGNDRIRYRKQFDMAQKNKPGYKAADFNFTLRNGTSSTLYQVRSKLLLIYFHNPDCPDCITVRRKIVQSAIIRQFTGSGMLQILSVYPDPDTSLWKEQYSELPASWNNGYDKGAVIKEKELYDLKAIPTLYLIDGSKTVLLRDASFEEIEGYLRNLK